MQKERHQGFDVSYWECFVKRVLRSLGWTLTAATPLFLNLPSLFQTLSVWDMSFRVETLFPFSSLISHPPFSPQAPSSSLQLSSPSFRPSVSLHISLGLVPMIKHSCRAHRKAPLFLNCYINWLAVFLALLILSDVNNCCLCLGKRTDSAVSSDCFDSGHSTNA